MTGAERKAGAKERSFTFIDEDATPKGALVWQDRRTKLQALIEWRRAAMAFGAKQSRVLRVAWLLSGLIDSSRTGYSYISDSRIAKETGIDDAHISATLAELENAGLLIRRHVRKASTTQRRIWFANPTAMAAVSPVPPPQAKSYRHDSGTGVIPGRARANSMSSTMRAARREADLKEARRAGIPVGLWDDEIGKTAER